MHLFQAPHFDVAELHLRSWSVFRMCPLQSDGAVLALGIMRVHDLSAVVEDNEMIALRRNIERHPFPADNLDVRRSFLDIHQATGQITAACVMAGVLVANLYFVAL